MRHLVTYAMGDWPVSAVNRRLVGPEPLTMAQVAAHISAAAGRPITYVESGRDEIRALLLAGGMPVEYADPVSELYVYASPAACSGC